MFSLPKRPGPYLLTLLLAVLIILTVWMIKVLEDPAVQKAVRDKAEQNKKAQEPVQSLAQPPPQQIVALSQATDPGILAIHEELVSPDTSPERELEIIQDLISQQQRAMGAGSFGDNSDITQALVGNSSQGVWIPRQSPRIREGELRDRWDSPYWVHSNAANQLEIRSAGPDKSLFTNDDIILNGSPAGYGATPADSLEPANQ